MMNDLEQNAHSGQLVKVKEDWKSLSECFHLSLPPADSPFFSPPLTSPETESFLDGFPNLSEVRREALTQHCPLCMHGKPCCSREKNSFRKGGGGGGGMEMAKAGATLW